MSNNIEKWDTILKWVFTFFILLAFLGWCTAALWISWRWLLPNPTASGIIEAAGLGAVTGAFIVWIGNILQYWFRKRPDYAKGAPAKPPSP